MKRPILPIKNRVGLLVANKLNKGLRTKNRRLRLGIVLGLFRYIKWGKTGWISKNRPTAELFNDDREPVKPPCREIQDKVYRALINEWITELRGKYEAKDSDWFEEMELRQALMLCAVCDNYELGMYVLHRKYNDDVEADFYERAALLTKYYGEAGW